MTVSDTERDYLSQYFDGEKIEDYIDQFKPEFRASCLVKYASCILESAREDFLEKGGEEDTEFERVQDILDEVLKLL